MRTEKTNKCIFFLKKKKTIKLKPHLDAEKVLNLITNICCGFRTSAIWCVSVALIYICIL